MAFFKVWRFVSHEIGLWQKGSGKPFHLQNYLPHGKNVLWQVGSTTCKFASAFNYFLTRIVLSLHQKGTYHCIKSFYVEKNNAVQLYWLKILILVILARKGVFKYDISYGRSLFRHMHLFLHDCFTLFWRRLTLLNSFQWPLYTFLTQLLALNYPLRDISFIYVGDIRDLETGYSFGELSCVISPLLPCTRRKNKQQGDNN